MGLVLQCTNVFCSILSNETNKLKEEPKPKKHKPNSSSGNNGSTKSTKLTMEALDDNLVLELGPDGHGNEYVYIPTMPHYLFVTSSNYDVWLHYEQCKQVNNLLMYLKHNNAAILLIKYGCFKFVADLTYTLYGNYVDCFIFRWRN